MAWIVGIGGKVVGNNRKGEVAGNNGNDGMDNTYCGKVVGIMGWI